MRTRGVHVSPLVFAYYLMFLCHHELHQYDDRDRALRLLVDTVWTIQNSVDVDVNTTTRINIAGHCLLLAGRTDRAREMFHPVLPAPHRRVLLTISITLPSTTCRVYRADIACEMFMVVGQQLASYLILAITPTLNLFYLIPVNDYNIK